MITRRQTIQMMAASVSTLSPNRGFADWREYKHEHSTTPSTGSSSHLPGYGESAFDEGRLEIYQNMPQCIFIIHHAKHIPHPEFDSLNLGVETYPIWVRDDAPVERVSLQQVLDALEFRRPLFSVGGKNAYIVRHKRSLNQAAFRNATGRIGADPGVIFRHVAPYLDYQNMADHCRKDNTAVLIGFRGAPFAGLRPLLVDGAHPRLDWRTYPLKTETHIYVRKSKDYAAMMAQRFLKALSVEREIDEVNWMSLASV